MQTESVIIMICAPIEIGHLLLLRSEHIVVLFDKQEMEKNRSIIRVNKAK